MPIATCQASPGRAVPASAKLVRVADGAVVVALTAVPVADGAGVTEKAGIKPLAGAFVSSIVSVVPTTLATKPVPAALILAARAAAISASETVFWTTY